MVWETTKDSIRSYQWDADSAPDQPWNCGPSGITTIAEFYKDENFDIEYTRKLGTSSHGRGTVTAERVLMLKKRGVACSQQKWTLAKLKASANGHHPIEIAVNLKHVPFSVRKHPFAGTHTQVALYPMSGICPTHRSTESGMAIFDPNFHRDRATHPRWIFYPDHYLKQAFEGYGGFCVVPDKPKVIPSRISYVASLKATTPVNIRATPTATSSDLGTLKTGTIIKTKQLERQGGKYVVNGKTRTDWVSYLYGGKTVWSARAFFTAV